MPSNIASERRRLGLTQQQLAEMIGKGRSSISKWENDCDSIDGGSLKALARIFSCSTDYLLLRTDERISYAGVGDLAGVNHE